MSATNATPFELFRALLLRRIDEVKRTLEGLRGVIQIEADDGRPRRLVIDLDGPGTRAFIGEAVRPDALIQLSRSASVGLLDGNLTEPVPVFGDVDLVRSLIARLAGAAPSGNWLDLRTRRGR
jgi:hypothetical protein